MSYLASVWFSYFMVICIVRICSRDLAFLFSFPQVSLDEENKVATVDREVDGGLETLCLDLPAVIT